MVPISFRVKAEIPAMAHRAKCPSPSLDLLSHLSQTPWPRCHRCCSWCTHVCFCRSAWPQGLVSAWITPSADSHMAHSFTFFRSLLRVTFSINFDYLMWVSVSSLPQSPDPSYQVLFFFYIAFTIYYTFSYVAFLFISYFHQQECELGGYGKEKARISVSFIQWRIPST